MTDKICLCYDSLTKEKERRTVKELILSVLLILAICNDCINYKIKNSIIVSGMAAGICFRIWEYGMMGVGVWFLGVALPIVGLWFLFRYRMLGAGDIKLFSMIGGMYEPSVIINIIVLAFLAGGILSIIRILQTGCLKNRLQYLAGFISSQ